VASDVLKELGKRVRQRRKARGWTQEQFAFEAEIDRSYVGGVERGQRNVTFTVLCRLCEALECDVAALTGGIPPVVNEPSRS
jgi:transcriptional regulator with XRE-family HTH domain